MNFKTLFEMAVFKGGYDKDTFSHENDWDYDYNPDDEEYNGDTKLIGQSNKGYKLWKTEYIMFLTSNTNKYLGAIEYSIIGKTLHIETAHSTLKSGFYKIMFTMLLKKYKELKSDHVLSKNAFKAYTNLTKTFNVQVVDRDGTYYEFTKDNLFVAGGEEDFDSRKHDTKEYFRTVSIKK